MDRTAYWIEKALQRAKITPDRGGEILYQAFKHLLAETMTTADEAAAAIAIDREIYRAALEDIAANTHCPASRQVAVRALHPPVREDADASSSTEAPSDNVFPLGKTEAAADRAKEST